MSTLFFAIAFTLGVSALCSLLEAFILSSTPSEIDSFSLRHTRAGKLLAHFKETIEESSTAILSLNTIANTAGATVVGGLTQQHRPEWALPVAVFMVVGILIFSEIVPKNLGVAYRKPLSLYLTYVLLVVRAAMKPFAIIMRHVLALFVKAQEPTEEEQEEEIRLMAERSVKAGALSQDERDLIANALSLDDVKVADLMTPRTVVTALEAEETVEAVLETHPNIPFGRLPVYGESTDEVVGVVRRRDILQAHSEDRRAVTMKELATPAIFIPEQASALRALQTFLAKKQQIGVVVDEFGSNAGVVTIEDIVEQLLGKEIYEDSDLAVDMRLLAKKRARRLPSVTPEQGEEASAELAESAHSA